MAFPDRLRLPLSFDPDRLAGDLAALPSDDWIAHFVTQNYEGDWSVIPLRGVAGATHPVMMIYPNPTATEFADTPMLTPCPYFREVLAAFACEVRTVRLMRLTPGSVIKEHNDPGSPPRTEWRGCTSRSPPATRSNSTQSPPGDRWRPAASGTCASRTRTESRIEARATGCI